MKSIDTGLVISCVGGPGEFSYKQSFNKNHYINSLTEEVFREEGIKFSTYPFDIHGSDERQYSSQSFRINTVTICKDKYYINIIIYENYYRYSCPNKIIFEQIL